MQRRKVRQRKIRKWLYAFWKVTCLNFLTELNANEKKSITIRTIQQITMKTNEKFQLKIDFSL